MAAVNRGCSLQNVAMWTEGPGVARLVSEGLDCALGEEVAHVAPKLIEHPHVVQEEGPNGGGVCKPHMICPHTNQRASKDGLPTHFLPSLSPSNTSLTSLTSLT